MLLVDIASVQAEGDSRVVIRFARVYGEQLYDATYHVQILPEHLVAKIPPDSLASSSFARSPIGSGPYRWDRLEPTEYLQLRAVPDFFLGTPAIEQMVWRFTTSQETRLGMLLSGEADVQEDLIPPVSNLERLSERPATTGGAFPIDGGELPALQRACPRRHDAAAPALCRSGGAARPRHSVSTAPPRPRRSSGSTPRGRPAPRPRRAWFGGLAPSPVEFDPKRASRILAGRGWKDSDGDGVLDRNGVALAFNLIVPSSSESRMQLALIIQDQLKRLGVRVEVVPHRGHPVLRASPPGRFRRQPGELRRRPGSVEPARPLGMWRGGQLRTVLQPDRRFALACCAPGTARPGTTHPCLAAHACRGSSGGVPLRGGPGLRHPEVLRQRVLPDRVALAASVDMDTGRHGPLR